MQQLYCTAVVKVTFGLVPSGVMPRLNPVPIRRSDDYLHGVPSLAGASEIAPQMLEADITIVGHAYANPRATKCALRFTMVRGDLVKIDKTIYVYGNRMKGGKPKPFRKMRIGYERALGGLDFPKNPIGVGVDKDSTRRPNVVDPKHPKKRAAGYGPYPARFLRRRQYRGDVRLDMIESGIADYPDDFKWKYFQCAPRDQRVNKLVGDEWIMLEGMHAEHARLRSRIPHARGFCRVYSRTNVGAPEMVDMSATMLHIEPDDDRCSLVFRGYFPIASELAAKQLVLAGAVQCRDEQLIWPATIDHIDMMASPAPASVAPPTGARDDDFYATVVSSQDHAPVRNLGGGYRLGENKIALAAAPAAVVGELRPEAALDEMPPQLPHSDVPPPPSYRSRASVRRQGLQPGQGDLWDSWAYQPPPNIQVHQQQVPHAAQGAPSPQYAVPQPPVSEPVQSSQVYSSQVHWSQQYSQPQPQPQAEVDLSSTDELDDPDEDAANDAGVDKKPAADAGNPFETTDEMEDPEGEAVEDAEHPLALTEVVIDEDSR
jgi:hypothetical protein